MSRSASVPNLAAHLATPRELRTLAFVMVVAATFAVVAITVIPSDYVANAVILLDTSGDVTNLINLAQMSDLLPPGALPSQSRKENGYTYAELTQSRAILMHMLATPRPSKPSETLFACFKPKRGSLPLQTEIAVRRLKKCISTKFDSRSGVFEISVRHHDRTVAFEIASLMVDELRRFNGEVRTTRAREAVTFVEQRLGESRVNLADAEQKLTSFKESNARIGNAPELLLQQKRLERDVRLNEDIYGLLAKQLELARIQEKRESPSFSVIDPAIEPNRPLRFSRLLGALLAAGIAGFAYILIQAGLPSLGRSEAQGDGGHAVGSTV